MPLCCRCHEAPRVPGQSYCASCRSAYMRAWRARPGNGWLARRLRALHGKRVNITCPEPAAREVA